VAGRQVVGAIAAVGIAGAGAVGLAVGGAAAPAQAFNGACATTVPAAVLVADGVCEVRISATGAFSFTPPSGISKLAAVLVGAGGGAGLDTTDSSSYAGNGGKVVYIDSLPLGGPVTGVVGVGGAASQNTGTTPSVNGTGTLIGATSADGGSHGLFSQQGCDVAAWGFWLGNGAQSDALGDPDCTPGVGFKLSQLAGVDTTLFPASADGTDVYGNGGAANPTDPGLVSALAGNGGSISETLAAPGANGLVIFRFAAAPTLAATGSAVSWTVPGASVALIALGGLMLALRRRRSAQH
jgi:hypothetical protein